MEDMALSWESLDLPMGLTWQIRCKFCRLVFEGTVAQSGFCLEILNLVFSTDEGPETERKVECLRHW